MYEVTVETTFSAAHALSGYRGKCEALHGHNYRVEATVAARALDSVGLAFDFGELRRLLVQVVEPLDHANLNDLAPFSAGAGDNPSAENVARYAYERLKVVLPGGIVLRRVNVWEAERSCVSYCED